MTVQNAFLQFLHAYDAVTKEGQAFHSLDHKFTVTGAVNNGAGQIRITGSGHGLKDGERVYLASINGTVEANNTPSNPNWKIDWVSASQFDLVNSSFVNAFTSSPNAFGVGALVGTVDSDKLTKERQLTCWNQARISFIQSLKKANTDLALLARRSGAHNIVSVALWTRSGVDTITPVPSNLVEFVNLISYLNQEILLLPSTYLSGVLRGDRYYLQSAARQFIFEEGLYYVHHGNLIDYATKTITNATNATPIVVTVSTAHGYATNDEIYNKDVTGNTAANGMWPITKLDDTSFVLVGSVGNGAFISGGTSRRLYRLVYTGITDWTLSDVVAGTAEETFGPDDIPELIQRAVAIARTIGGAIS